MYIAVVADNIADRKQAERLLERANTALAPKIGTLYISAFGDEAAFLHACMKFDLFLLDFDGDPAHSLAIADQLKEMNAPGVAAICKHHDAPFSHDIVAKGYYTIDKPILTAPLHKLITDAHEEVTQRRSRLCLVELRGEKETLYIPKDEIVYIEIDEGRCNLVYHLKDREPFPVSGDLGDLARALGSYPQFELRLKNICINTDYILEENKKSILLSTGERFSRSFLQQLFSL